MPKPIKWTIRIVLIVVLLVVALLAAAAKWWIIPSVARDQISKGLGEVWEGDVEVGKIEFNYFGPIRFGGLAMKDSGQREWVKIGPMTYGLGNWPSAGPKLQTVEVNGVTIRAHMIDGKIVWPLKKQPKKEEKEPTDLDKYLDIQEVVVDDISLGVMIEGGQDILWPTLKLSVKREGDQYRIDFGPKEPAAQGAPALTGTLAKKGPIDLNFNWQKHFTPNEIAMLVTLAGKEYVRNASGRLMADVHLTGDATDPESMAPHGYISLVDWQGEPIKGPAVTNLNADVTLDGQVADLTKFTADAAGGQLAATGQVKRSGERGYAYRLKGGTAKVLELPELVNSFTAERRFKQGELGMQFDLAGDDSSKFPSGQIKAAITKADLYKVKLLEGVFSAIRLAEPALVSKVQADIDFRDMIVTISSASAGGGLTRVEVAKGGTVNLDTGEFDTVVITVPSKQAAAWRAA